MSFMNLYHAIWDTQSVLGMDIPGVNETMTKMDIRTREAAYLSPEQLKIGKKLKNIGEKNYGMLSMQNNEIEMLMQKSNNIISQQCDIFSLGVILYRLLLGEEPTPETPGMIKEQKLELESPDNDVFQAPFFL